MISFFLLSSHLCPALWVSKACWGSFQLQLPPQPLRKPLPLLDPNPIQLCSNTLSQELLMLQSLTMRWHTQPCTLPRDWATTSCIFSMSQICFRVNSSGKTLIHIWIYTLVRPLWMDSDIFIDSKMFVWCYLMLPKHKEKMNLSTGNNKNGKLRQPLLTRSDLVTCTLYSEPKISDLKNKWDFPAVILDVGHFTVTVFPLPCSCIPSSCGQRCVATRSCGKNYVSAGSTWNPWWQNSRGVVASVSLLVGLMIQKALLQPHSLSAEMKGRRHISPGLTFKTGKKKQNIYTTHFLLFVRYKPKARLSVTWHAQ